MTTISAPKKFSNFPVANTLTDSMSFLVADAETGTSYRLSPNLIAQYCNVAPSQNVQSTSNTTSTIKKFSNFAMANVLSGNMVFLVADTETGTNYRISPAMIAQYCNVAPSQQVDVPGGVAGINANGFISEAELPLPAVTLTTLLANKLA